MSGLLVTQCLQRDFIGPLAPQDPLPNRLHVGHAEAMRLMGHDPSRGPVAQLMAWARAQPVDDLDVLHVRDWHDASDPSQRDHLQAFGHHCVRDTPGARLVLDLDDQVAVRPNERYVNAIGLNDFEETGLTETIAQLRARSPGPLRVGVAGVWTEAKITFLLYDLKTRCGIDELATCSALTASASRAQHFNALEQLQRILGVRVFDSVGEFAQWLVPDGAPVEVGRLTSGARPVIEGAELEAGDQDLMACLYRDAAHLQLSALGGGFSGASVFAVQATDALGHVQAPSVAKLGPRSMIGKERAAFERVEAILGNDAPSIRGFVDLGERAGLKYAYAAMGRGQVSTLKARYEAGADIHEIERILRTVFDEILARFTRAATYERLPLLHYYGFAPRHAASVGERVRELVGADDPEGQRLVRFYAEDLGVLTPADHEHHYVSYVHGDLNTANILVDSRDNVWLVDFFHTRRGHVLQDLVKLENDLLYILTPIADEHELAQARALTRALAEVRDLRAPLPLHVDGVTAPALQRAWAVVRVLRDLAAGLARERRDPVHHAVASLRYAAHTLSFEESSTLQKRWALHAAASHADAIVERHRLNRQLRVDWLREAKLPGRLGLTICPGRADRGRDLAEDLDAIVRDGGAALVCLIGEDEMVWAGVEDLPARARAKGLDFLHLPVPDQQPPALAEASRLVGWIASHRRAGRDVVVHCMGGLGRSGCLAAACLVAEGELPVQAIRHVRDARGPRAVESSDQEAFVERYCRSHRAGALRDGGP